MAKLTDAQLEEIDRMHKFPDEPVTQAAYARYAGISRQAISNEIRRGALSTTRDRKIVPRVADAERAAIANINAIDIEDAVDDAESYKKARAQKEIHNARLAELKVLEQEGELVSREAVDDFVFRTIRNARNKFQNLHKKLAPRIAPINDHHEISKMIREEVEDILRDLDVKLRAGE